MKLNSLQTILRAGLLSGLLGASLLSAEEPTTTTWEEFFLAGKAVGDFRLRYEHGEQTGLGDSDAFTIRSRVGFLSGKAYGLQALVEFEDVRLLNGQDDVNLAGSNPEGAGKTAIADPEATELNRAWVSYTIDTTVLKGGRQRIKLDDDRFIGNVGWRQNEQTFDSVSAKSTLFDQLDLFAAYMWKVQRIFGDAAGASPDFTGDNFVINAGYTFSKAIKLVGFAYFLELDNAVSGAAFSGSGDTLGLRATGTVPLGEVVSFAYAGSYAWQTDNGGSPSAGARSDFDLEYFAFDGTFTFSGISLGGGLEILEGDGTSMFATPLATVHAFQGWADVFLGNSISGTGLGSGIKDLYLSAGYKIPVGKGIVLKGLYHWFETESSAPFDGDYGNELDLLVVYPINKYFKAIAKYANYDGSSDAGNPLAADVERIWLELNLSF